MPSPCLHIGGAMSMVAPDRALACAEVFPKRFFDGFDVIEVPPDDFVSGKVLVEAAQEVAAERLHEAGVEVHSVDLSEFVQGSGSPTCLILPVERG